MAMMTEVTTRWLQYWMVFALFTMVESIVDMVGAFLPFFYEAKLLFMLWLSLDKFQGATYLYKRFIEPALDQHHGSIDEQLNFVVDRAAIFVEHYLAHELAHVVLRVGSPPPRRDCRVVLLPAALQLDQGKGSPPRPHARQRPVGVGRLSALRRAARLSAVGTHRRRRAPASRLAGMPRYPR